MPHLCIFSIFSARYVHFSSFVSPCFAYPIFISCHLSSFSRRHQLFHSVALPSITLVHRRGRAHNRPSFLQITSTIYFNSHRTSRNSPAWSLHSASVSFVSFQVDPRPFFIRQCALKPFISITTSYLSYPKTGSRSYECIKISRLNRKLYTHTWVNEVTNNPSLELDSTDLASLFT